MNKMKSTEFKKMFEKMEDNGYIYIGYENEEFTVKFESNEFNEDIKYIFQEHGIKKEKLTHRKNKND